MQFTIKCKNCGEYEVKEDSFKSFISPELQARLSENPEAVKARLIFESEGCPRCRQLGKGIRVTMSVFSPRKK